MWNKLRLQLDAWEKDVLRYRINGHEAPVLDDHTRKEYYQFTSLTLPRLQLIGWPDSADAKPPPADDPA